MKDLAKLYLDPSNIDWSFTPKPQYLPPYSPQEVQIELSVMKIQLEWLKEKEENGTR